MSRLNKLRIHPSNKAPPLVGFGIADQAQPTKCVRSCISVWVVLGPRVLVSTCLPPVLDLVVAGQKENVLV